MGKNKATSYLLYAIGEIALVVIGILIAVQIDNWNEGNKLKQWEVQFLHDLKSELKLDIEQLEKIIAFQRSKGQYFEILISKLQNGELDDKELIDSLFNYSQIGNDTFFPTTAVFENAMQSGKIELISNQELKYNISNLYLRYYKRLVYNGEIYDQRVEQTSWEIKGFFDGVKGEFKSKEAIRDPQLYSVIEFLYEEYQIYEKLAGQNIQHINSLLNQIENELN